MEIERITAGNISEDGERLILYGEEVGGRRAAIIFRLEAGATARETLSDLMQQAGEKRMELRSRSGWKPEKETAIPAQGTG
jgi:hypothetical protein